MSDTIDIEALETKANLTVDASIDDATEAFITELEESERSEGSVKTYTNRWKAFVRWLDGEIEPKDITEHVLTQYLKHLKDRDLKWKTRRTHYYTIKIFLDFFDGETDAYPDGTPTDNIDTSHIPTGKKSEKKTQNKDIPSITPDEKELLCEHVEQPKVRNELIIRLFYQTGIRGGELRNIQLSDIDRDEREINIDEEKNNEYRTVYYQPSLDTLMSQWIDINRESLIYHGSPYLFISHQSEHLGPDRPNDVIKEAAHNAGIQYELYQDASGQTRWGITAHSLRHTHALQSLKNGIDVRRLQKHLGHDSIDMTMEYLEALDQDVKEAYRDNGPGSNKDFQ